MSENKVVCSHISIDCRINDAQDIKMGGPQYLGFDFYVAAEQAKEMEKFIEKAMNDLQIPISSLCIEEDEVLKPPSKVWNKKKIMNCLKENATEMIGDEHTL